MPPALAGWCICSRSQRMRPCKRDEQSSGPCSFGNSMLRVRGLKARMRKECAAWGCGGRTTMACPDALPTYPDGGSDQSGAHRCLAAGKVARVNLPASSRFTGHSPAVPTVTTAPPGGVLTVSSFDVIRQQSLTRGGILVRPPGKGHGGRPERPSRPSSTALTPTDWR